MNLRCEDESCAFAVMTGLPDERHVSPLCGMGGSAERPQATRHPGEERDPCSEQGVRGTQCHDTEQRDQRQGADPQQEGSFKGRLQRRGPQPKPRHERRNAPVEKLNSAPVAAHATGEPDLARGLRGKVDRCCPVRREAALEARGGEDDTLGARISVIAMEDDPDRHPCSGADCGRPVAGPDRDIYDLPTVRVDPSPHRLLKHHHAHPLACTRRVARSSAGPCHAFAREADGLVTMVLQQKPHMRLLQRSQLSAR